MNNAFPIPFDQYRELSFHQYYFTLFRFGWLDSDGTTSYTFICVDLIPMGDKTGRIKIIHRENPEQVLYNEQYYLELFFEEEKLYIAFLGERFKVFSIRVYEGAIPAARLELLSSSNVSHILYSTHDDPFKPLYNQIYGIQPLSGK